MEAPVSSSLTMKLVIIYSYIILYVLIPYIAAAIKLIIIICVRGKKGYYACFILKMAQAIKKKRLF